MIGYLLRRSAAYSLDYFFVSLPLVFFAKQEHFSLIILFFSEILLGILYFVFLPFYWNNQTLFMRVFSLKFEGKVTVWCLFLRFLLVIGIFVIGTFRSLYSFQLANFYSIIAQAYMTTSIFPLIMGKTRLSLWDQLLGIRVIDLKGENSGKYSRYFDFKNGLVIFFICFLFFMITL